MLPPLFLILREVFDVGFTELGAVMTTFFVVSGFSQAPCGFLVDRLGARRVLFTGMTLMACAIILFGLVPTFWLMFPVAILAGLGNSVFHPADYTILSASIAPARLGRAYSIHNLGGNLGWAAAPPFVLVIASLADWRIALVSAGCLGLIMVLIMFLRRDLLRDGEPETADRSVAARHQVGIAPLLSRAVVLCFVYFVMLSIATVAANSFLPVTLSTLHGIPLAGGAAVLTAFLISGAVGMLAGGFMADWSRRHDQIVVLGLLAAGLVFLAVSLSSWPTTWLVVGLVTAGLFLGVTMPSRDMLVRRSAPQGAIGRVFGFVYSGLDTGAAIAPVIVGWLLDQGHPAAVFRFIAVVLAVGVLSVAVLPRRANRAIEPAG